MNIAVIFAGGVGTRMHSREKPKQFLNIYNKPIIIYTLEVFQENSDVEAIVISCVKDWIPYLEKLVDRYGITKVQSIVPGGETGQLSIYNGLVAAREIGDDNSIVLIHDGVRPLIHSDLLTSNIQCVKQFGSCITAGVVKETIVVIDGEGNIQQVPSRAHSRVAKAPQSFYLKDILGVHEEALRSGETDSIDSCTLMTKHGYSLHMIDGPYENIKITTPDDFYTMRALLDARENAQIYGLD